MFIIDTPLHGFDEGLDETAPESMRTALFNTSSIIRMMGN
jgi:hypothetical protein